MKNLHKGKILFVASLALLQLVAPVHSANSVEVQVGKLVFSVPDSVIVTGSEVGLSERNCAIKVTVDALAGETIPLRGGVNVNLLDSLNTIIDSGYSSALVEGLTRQEFVLFFRCNNTNGTLKPPYRFEISDREGYGGQQIPVNLTFVPKVEKPTQTPTPEPTNVISPSPSASSTPNPVVSKVKKTITCVKGKLTKKVTAINPKCPAGYKKK